MKMTRRDFSDLSSLLDSVLQRTELATWEQMRHFYKAQGLTPERCRWDCFHGIPQERRVALTHRLYAYLNDTHIDTALRRIVNS